MKSHISTAWRVAVLIGLVSGLGWGLSWWLEPFGEFPLVLMLGNGLAWGLGAGLGAGLICWLLLGFFQGVSGATIEDQRRVVPNQGIHRSALNGFVFGLISTVIVGLLVWLSAWLSWVLSSGLSFGLTSYSDWGLSILWTLNNALGEVLDWGLSQGLSYALSNGLLTGVLAGLSTGLLVGLLYGGLASFRHYVLRFLLWRTGSIPWHYAPFLDYAAERILLRKVGGGYIFLHRLLLDYFAARENAPVFSEPTERKQVSTPAPVSPSNAPSEPMVPTVLPDLSAPTISLAPPTNLSEARHSLPCGHELSIPSAHFCSVCGAPITMPGSGSFEKDSPV